MLEIALKVGDGFYSLARKYGFIKSNIVPSFCSIHCRHPQVSNIVVIGANVGNRECRETEGVQLEVVVIEY